MRMVDTPTRHRAARIKLQNAMTWSRLTAGLAAAVTGSLLASVAAPAAAATTSVDTNYTLDTSATLTNPERGMFFARHPNPKDTDPTSSKSHSIVAEWLHLDTVCGQNLTWNGYLQPGTSSVLNGYARKLRERRAPGSQGGVPAPL